MDSSLPQRSSARPPAAPALATPLFGNLRHHAGEPEQPPMQGRGSLQPFSHGLLLWWPEAGKLLMLHADGRVGSFATSDVQRLGEPLAPAAEVALRWQKCRHATLFWSAPTGLLLLQPDRWQVPLGSEVTR